MNTFDMHKSEEKRITLLLIDSDGFSDYTCYLARGLSKYLDVILYGFSEQSFNVTGAAKVKGIEFNCIQKRLPKGYSTIKGIIRVILLFFILFSALVRTKYDIVHIQDYLPTFFLFIPLLRLRNKKICWTLHDLEVFHLASGLGGKLQVTFLKLVSQPTLLKKYVDSIIVHAESLKKELILKNVNQNKINVVRFFDYQYLLEFNENNSRTKSDHSLFDEGYVLFLGNIAPWKGIDTLIGASRIVRDSVGDRFKLVIAGAPYEGLRNIQFFANIRNQDLNFIKILDRYIVYSEIPDLVNNSKFLVLPYNNLFRYSASGIIPLAYTFSKPVVVSNIPSLSEYVKNGETGLIHRVNSQEHLAKCIIDLIQNNPKCVEMGQNAHRKLLNEMSLNICCQNTLKIYNKLI